MIMKEKYIISLLMAVLITSCQTGETNEERNVSKETGVELVLQKSAYDQNDIQFEHPSVATVNNIIVLNGFLEVPPESKSIISTYFPGYVQGLELLEGQKIKKGQVLAYIQNPDFIQIQQDYLIAKEQLKYLQEDFERKKELNTQNITSKKEYLKAESDYKVTLAQYNGLKEKLRLLNVNTGKVEAGNITSVIAIVSPMNGNVSAIHAANGAFLSPSDKIAEIVSTEHLHLELQVFEADLQYIKAGQKVDFRLSQWNDAWYTAEVYLVGTEIDEDTRTVRLHCHFDGPDSVQFIPGLYAEARVVTGRKEIFSLPEDALYKANDVGYVWVKKVENDSAIFLEKRWVKPGLFAEGRVEVKEGEIDNDLEVLVAPVIE